MLVQVALAAGVGAVALVGAARLAGPDRGARAAALIAVALLWPLPWLASFWCCSQGSCSRAAPDLRARRQIAHRQLRHGARSDAHRELRRSRDPLACLGAADHGDRIGRDRPPRHLVDPARRPCARGLVEGRFGVDDGLSEGLVERGFLVADQARANYGQTLYSVLASLNLDYVDATLGGEGRRSRVAAALRDTRLARTLREAGYRTVFWPGGYRQLEPAFDGIGGPRLIPSEYQLVLLGRSLPVALAERVSGYSIARSWRSWFVTAQLAAMQPEAGGAPAFHFVHVLSPHPPFVASAEGRSETIFDASGWENKNPGGDYREGYARQVEWLRPQVLAAVDRLLAGGRPWWSYRAITAPASSRLGGPARRATGGSPRDSVGIASARATASRTAARYLAREHVPDRAPETLGADLRPGL